jgi:uncharacterized membrane protein
MWTRAELKSQAKNTLRSNYGLSIVAGLIVWAIAVAASSISNLIPFLGGLASIAITFFVTNPLAVGQNYFFMQNRLAPAQLQNVFQPFGGDRYMKIVGATAWKTLFLFLWSLIPIGGILISLSAFIGSSLPSFMRDSVPTFNDAWIAPIVVCSVIYIAGIVIVTIKQLSYSMTEYILTDNPYIRYDRALKLSIDMTNGYKWQIFVLGLSFIGWSLLAIITLCLGFIFLMPYINATYAELYVRLRNTAIQNGLTSPQELNLIPAGGPGPQTPPYGAPYGTPNTPGDQYSQPYGAAGSWYNAPPDFPAAPQPPSQDGVPQSSTPTDNTPLSSTPAGNPPEAGPGTPVNGSYYMPAEPPINPGSGSANEPPATPGNDSDNTPPPEN